MRRRNISDSRRRLAHGGYENICTLTFIDISEEVSLNEELTLMRPVVALIQVDNYEELSKDLSVMKVR